VHAKALTMLLQPGAPPQAPQAPSSLQVLGGIVWRIVTQLATARAHCDVIITIKDGRVQFVRVNQTFLPEQLPRG
jgi:hypothetical protein